MYVSLRTFTSFVISYPGGTLDTMAHPNSTFSMPAIEPYDVTFTIHMGSESVANSTDAGQTWITSNWRGYSNGECLDGALPNIDLTFTKTVGHTDCACSNPQRVTWGTEGGFAQYYAISYGVEWPTVNSTTTTTSTNTTTVLNTTTTTSTLSDPITMTAFLSRDTPALSLVSMAMFVLTLIFRYFLKL